MKQWITKTYPFLARNIPNLIKEFSWTKTKELISQYGSLSKDILSFMSNIFKGGFDGNESMLAQLFKALEKPNFGEFLSATGELASKKGDVFREMDGKDFGDFVNAYNADPTGTTKIIKEFSNKPETEKANKDTLMNALKPSALRERVQIAIENAKKFTLKSQLDEREKEEAKKAHETLNKLLDEIKRILGNYSK
ncbi:hypothetical protein A6V39_00980 [Candidatus Mycoplasma haematobovis]|uniref:Uncharacterized protein n=1 Tax=Candidatus Mycoplasma haematobovis TaxID=432608 RepID=A0A1A9QFA0_9MOLU|nr:hypothetical protein [Candidatus Mycoplasma haematobovis]OAL10626.1 hypothetical protein A6V39_00980 [Candidatus Mycoplasma haematobovis]